jgi:hypothetical protein
LRWLEQPPTPLRFQNVIRTLPKAKKKPVESDNELDIIESDA